MKRFIGSCICLMMLAACNQSPEQKTEKAQEQMIDAKAKAQEQRRAAEQNLSEKQAVMDKATNEANREIRDSQEQVHKAHEDMAKVKAELASDKADALEKLNKRLRSLEERVAKLTQLPAKTDPEEQNKFAQTMILVNDNLSDARTKIGSFAQVSPSEWQGPYETANNALTKLEDSIQKAE